MSRFFSKKYAALTPYTPGEQPQDMKYIKLNTNESPFPPSEKAVVAAEREARRLELYSDPECRALTEKMAELLDVSKEEILFTNGSDDILNFAFMAFCDDETPAAFCDITYGFYPVFARLNGVKYEEIPLREDYTVDVEKFYGIGKTIFIANPNAPTGIALPLSEIEEIVKRNPDNVVVVDEAYVDFGAESAVKLIHKYPNLLVTQTFSKSRSMAGGRLGFGVGCRELIRDLNTLKYSTNPYNINRMTMAAGIGIIEDEAYTRENCEKICQNREFTVEELSKLGFETLSSSANFIFTKNKRICGANLYSELKSRGILVRYFDKPRLSDFVRITIGSREQMEALIKTIK
ncbi:MAG: histidinol-phosphate transaminase, partial [Oscillospiraceae bacterium]|nr:histidinol-phosphate transaminase [Oscillospiraceae bacterium]